MVYKNDGIKGKTSVEWTKTNETIAFIINTLLISVGLRFPNKTNNEFNKMNNVDIRDKEIILPREECLINSNPGKENKIDISKIAENKSESPK